MLFGSGFSNKKKQSFYLELAVLLKAGITIKEALTLLIESFKKKKDKEMLENVLHQVVNGKPFSEALRNSKYFSEYEYYSLHSVKRFGTNHIERKNLTLRTHLKRLNRGTICFSRSLIVLNAVLKIYFWS